MKINHFGPNAVDTPSYKIKIKRWMSSGEYLADNRGALRNRVNGSSDREGQNCILMMHIYPPQMRETREGAYDLSKTIAINASY